MSEKTMDDDDYDDDDDDDEDEDDGDDDDDSRTDTCTLKSLYPGTNVKSEIFAWAKFEKTICLSGMVLPSRAAGCPGLPMAGVSH